MKNIDERKSLKLNNEILEKIKRKFLIRKYRSLYSSYGSYSSFALFSSYGSYYSSRYSSYGSYFTSGNVPRYFQKEFMINHIMKYEKYLEILRKIENIGINYENNHKIREIDISNQMQVNNFTKKNIKDMNKGTLSYGFFSLGYGIELI